MLHHRLLELFLLLVCVLTTEAQFPAACSDSQSLSNRSCCPSTTSSECSGRGTCVNVTVDWSNANQIIVNLINSSTVEFGMVDARYIWPNRVFTQVCNCEAGYGGADCSECNYGYEMNDAGDCVPVTTRRVRRNIRKLEDSERMDLIKVLNESKNEHKNNYRWAVIVEEPTDVMGTVTLQKVSTYDFFVYLHFLVGREAQAKNDDKTEICSNWSKINFAHEGPTFPTWHRYYHLLVERELGRIAERLKKQGNISTDWNRYNFGLPYWDWKTDDDETVKLFTYNMFGNLVPDSAQDETSPDPKDVNWALKTKWKTVCDLHYRYATKRENTNCTMLRKPCNPDEYRMKNAPDGILQRGRFIFRGTENDTNRDIRSLPVSQHINELLKDSTVYEELNEAFNGDKSFRKRLEGFVKIKDGKFTSRDPMEDPPHNFIHNAVHIYIFGHMEIIASASNDPIFWLHHGNIDRIFEKWLRMRSDRSTQFVPASGAHPGHNQMDYLVPFFPLKTNNDMYKESTAFGYEYDTLPDVSDDGDDADRLIPSLLLLLGGIIAVSLLI